MKEISIPLSARKNTPATTLYGKLYSQSEQLGERDVVILLPGGPGNDYSMYNTPGLSIAQTFFKTADVILFDPRGCGQSEQSELQYCSLDHYIDDVEAIREYFNLSPDRFIVFGQSYGSIAALGYACRYPDSLKKLLIIGAVASHEFFTQAQEELAQIGNAEQVEFAKKLWTGTFDGSREEVVKFYELMSPLYAYTFEPGEPPLDIPYTVDIMNFGWGDFLHKFDFRDQLKNITCETLLLWGENEWIMPKRQVDLVHNAISNCTLKIYPKCMHMLWIDQWELFKRDSLGFLEG